MKKLFLLVISLLIGCCFSYTLFSQVQKSGLKILYVGGSADIDNSMREHDPESDDYKNKVKERMASFEEFLKQYFKSVTVVHADEYSQSLSDDYDVTIMDGTPKPVLPAIMNREAGVYMRAAYFTEDFAKPVLTIGELAETLLRRIGSKNDWYCLCLDADAHHWRAEHPIFNGPFPVRMSIEMKPTPEDAYHYSYYYEGEIPDQIPMWRVQTKGYMTDKGFRVGMVARPWGYEDSPDAEYISSGVCAKTLDAVAIGRHGNFFHWGFAASPRYMTEEAKTVLANAICYIAQFDGQGMIARKYNDRIATREYLKELTYLASVESWKERVELDKKFYQEMKEGKAKALAKQAKGEALTQEEKSYLGYSDEMAVPMSLEDYLKRYQGAQFNRFGMDIEAYHNYYSSNHDYFYSEADGSYKLLLDEDAKHLGIPNNDKRLLEEAIRMLENGQNTDMGRRILRRYTLFDFQTPEQWRNWYETNKEKLFFTESGGWYWLINSHEPGVNDYSSRQKRRATESIATTATDDKNPVAIATEVKILQNGNRLFVAKIKIHPGYHIYSHVASSDPFIATTINFEMPEGYIAVGSMQRPTPEFYNSKGTTIYHDEIVFLQEFAGQGTGELKVTVSYQCCDNHICFPPETKEYTIELK